MSRDRVFADPDLGPIASGQYLRHQLRQLREQADMTQQVVATELDWSLSKVVRMEAGDSGIRRTDLLAMLTLYATDQHIVDELTHCVRKARERTWLNSYRRTVSRQFFEFLEYEMTAQRIRQFHIALIPELLQTPEYAAALSVAVDDDDETRDLAVSLCVERQRNVVERSDPPEMHFLLDEAALRHVIGGDAVMRRQFAALRAKVRESHIKIGVVPFARGERPEISAASWGVFDGLFGEPLATIDSNYRTASVVRHQGLFKRYDRYLDILAGMALTKAQTLEEIDKYSAALAET